MDCVCFRGVVWEVFQRADPLGLRGWVRAQMSKKTSKRDGGALYKGMKITLSDIVVGDTLGECRDGLEMGCPPPQGNRRGHAASRRERAYVGGGGGGKGGGRVQGRGLPGRRCAVGGLLLAAVCSEGGREWRRGFRWRFHFRRGPV